MAVTFEQLMQGFGIVTVMDVCIYKIRDSYTGTSNCCSLRNEDNALSPSKWEKTGEHIDTLKIANLTQEGPTKTITGGKYANTLIKYGKTMTCEMQDALGRASTMERFFGCTYDSENDRLSISDNFPGPFAMEGKTFFIDQKSGEKHDVYIFIPQFIPDAILTLTQDAEGDATVFDLNGTLGVTKVCDEAGFEGRDIFYEIRENSFFLSGRETATEKGETEESVELKKAKAEAISNLKGYAEIIGVEWDDTFVTEIQDATTIEGVDTAKASAKTAIDGANI